MWDDLHDEAGSTRDHTLHLLQQDEEHSKDTLEPDVPDNRMEIDANYAKKVKSKEFGDSSAPKVLEGVFREAQSFEEDVCSKSDRELMRIFP